MRVSREPESRSGPSCQREPTSPGRDLPRPPARPLRSYLVAGAATCGPRARDVLGTGAASDAYDVGRSPSSPPDTAVGADAVSRSQVWTTVWTTHRRARLDHPRERTAEVARVTGRRARTGLGPRRLDPRAEPGHHTAPDRVRPPCPTARPPRRHVAARRRQRPDQGLPRVARARRGHRRRSAPRSTARHGSPSRSIPSWPRTHRPRSVW